MPIDATLCQDMPTLQKQTNGLLHAMATPCVRGQNNRLSAEGAKKNIGQRRLVFVCPLPNL